MTLGEAVSAHPFISAAIIVILAAAYIIYTKRPKRAEPPAAPPEVKETPAAPVLTRAAVSEGEFDARGVDDITAALIVAAVAERSGVPPDELKIVSVARVGPDRSGGAATTDKKYAYAIDEEPGMKYTVTINDNAYEVIIERNEASARAAERPAAGPARAAGDKNILKAPLSGAVLDIPVSAGDSVKAGQVLLILEAMKMENEIVSPGDHRVARVFVVKGGAVNTGDPLFELE